MNHGRKKRTEEPLSAEAIQKRDETAAKVQELTQSFLEIRNGKKVVPNPLEYTTLVARMCPDFPSVYNLRRELFETQFKTISAEEQYKVLSEEIDFTFVLLKHNPKSYAIWSHRQWLVVKSRELEKVVDTKITAVDKELMLCTKMLKMDERNFHAWNYRNWLIRDVLNEDEKYVGLELEFTKEKINSNFSNFSAFHFRTKNLRRYYTLKRYLQNKEDKQLLSEIVAYGMPLSVWQEDLELVKNAIYIQPNEQGLWQYYQWLLSQIQPYGVTKITTEDNNGDSLKLILNFNQKVSSISNNLTIGGGIQFKENSDRFSYQRILEIQKSELQDQQVIQLKGNLQIFVEDDKEGVVDMINEKRNFVPFSFRLEKNTSNDGKFQVSDFQRTTDNIDSVRTHFESEIAFVDELIQEKENKNNHYSRLHKIQLVKMQLALKTVLGEKIEEADIQKLDEAQNVLQYLETVIPNQYNYLQIQKRKIGLTSSILRAKLEGKVFTLDLQSNQDLEIDEIKVFL